MTPFEKILYIDYTSFGLSSIDQLIFIKLAHSLSLEVSLGFSSKSLCNSCACSKPTLHLSLSKLEDLGFISISRVPGFTNIYSLNSVFIETLVPANLKAHLSFIDEEKKIEDSLKDLSSYDEDYWANLENEGKKEIREYDLLKEHVPLTKNQRKRRSKKSKKR